MIVVIIQWCLLCRRLSPQKYQQQSNSRIQGPKWEVLANHSALMKHESDKCNKTKVSNNASVCFLKICLLSEYYEFYTYFDNACAKYPHSNYKWQSNSWKIWFSNWNLGSGCWQGAGSSLSIKRRSRAFKCTGTITVFL